MIRTARSDAPFTRTPARSSALCALLLSALAASGLVGCVGPNYLMDPAPVNSDLTVHVVIENPTGSDQKWEVRSNGKLLQENDPDTGEHIRIPYLPWPVNGGMIPRTLYSESLGGDREPIDAIVLGPSLARGQVVRVRPIGLLRVIDHLERDDKVIAVFPDSVFGDIQDVDDLEREFPGIRDILALWFARSRPGGGIEVQGFGTRAEAGRLISEGAVAFSEALESDGLREWSR